MAAMTAETSRDRWAEVATWLADPATHAGLAVGLHETHGALVALVGDRAFKLKKPVRFPYMDFSTPGRRRRMLTRELALNRRTAPELYLGLRRVTVGADGGFAFDGRGPAVEWVLEMRRFADGDRLDHRLATRDLPPLFWRDLADRVAAFHLAEPPLAVDPRHVLRRSLSDARAIFPTLTDAARAALGDEGFLWRLDAIADALRAVDHLLAIRTAAGAVIRGHGDLHLANIVVIDGRPVLFDALEWNRDFAEVDRLHDLAFLVMDLVRGDARAPANAVLNRWCDQVREDPAALGALAPMIAVRAMIRAHVEAVQGRLASAARAVAILDLALAPGRPALVVIGGLSGTGKSTLARALAPEQDGLVGARWLASDNLRKRLHGVAPETRLSGDAYRPEVSARVYAGLRAEAEATLAAGMSVVVDALNTRPEDRHWWVDLARRRGVPFQGLWLDLPLDLRAARVGDRRDDASDAGVAVARAQEATVIGSIDWPRLVATDRDATLAAARALLRSTSA
jgi:hypothetical protein